MNFNICLLNKISFIYLLISLLIFIVGWLNPLFMTISFITLIFIVKSILKEKNDNKTFFLEKDYIIIILSISAIWCILAGIGGWFWQVESDWHIRNALMHDLVTFDFPVFYEGNNALAYYFGFMLVPALAGKWFLILGGSASLVIFAANFTSFIWASCGIFLIMLYIINITGVRKQQTIAAVLIFILFSGLDILLSTKPLHLSVWSNMANCLNNSYHITVPIWLLTLLYIQNKNNIKYYGLISLLVLFYCPQIIFGFAVFMIPMAFLLFIKNIKNLKSFIKELFDIKNILSFLVIAPLIILFYTSNFTSTNNQFFFHSINSEYLKFFFYEYGIYLVLTIFKFYKNIIFYLTLLSLLLIPAIGFYSSFDFALRVLMPSEVIMVLFVIQTLFMTYDKHIILNKTLKYLISFVLFIGFLTPLTNYSGNLDLYNKYPEIVVKNKIITFNNKIDKNVGWDGTSDNRNYASIDYEQYPFWKYIARKQRKFNIEDYINE